MDLYVTVFEKNGDFCWKAQIFAHPLYLTAKEIPIGIL